MNEFQILKKIKEALESNETVVSEAVAEGDHLMKKEGKQAPVSEKADPENFQWQDELQKIIDDWKEGSKDPLDGDEVDALVEIIRKKINYMEGNITKDEYLEDSKQAPVSEAQKEKRCRYCQYMQDYGTEGSMRCTKNLSKGDKTAETCPEYKPIYESVKEKIEEKAPAIKAENPGILEVPEGKHFWDLPLKHFIELAKKKGKPAIARAINNIARWMKNKAPDVAAKARELMDRLKGNSEWEAIGATESVNPEDVKRYTELAEKLYLTHWLKEQKRELSEKEKKFVSETESVQLSDIEREFVFEKFLDMLEGVNK